jgi:hypothetical protein
MEKNPTPIISTASARSLTSSEFLSLPAIAQVIGLSHDQWTDLQAIEVDMVMANGTSVLLDGPAELRNKAYQIILEIEARGRASLDPDSTRTACDPVLITICWIDDANPFPSSDYLKLLNLINVLQGGSADAVGQAGEPIQFLDDRNQIICRDDETCQRLIDALHSHYPQQMKISVM